MNCSFEFVGAPAIEGKRGERAERLHIAHHLAEIGLQSPEADQHRTRHAELLLDLGEGAGVLLEQRRSDLQPVVGHHAVGELQEGLREHRLAAILGDGGGIVGQAVERGESLGEMPCAAASCLKPWSQRGNPAGLGQP